MRKSGQPGALQIQRRLLEQAMRESRGTGVTRRATCMQVRFEIVKIEHRPVAHLGQLLEIRSTPEVFDDAEGVSPARGGAFDFALEPGEPVDQRWRRASGSHCVAKSPRRKTTAVHRQVDNGYPAHQPRGNGLERVRRARRAEDQEVHVVAAGQRYAVVRRELAVTGIDQRGRGRRLVREQRCDGEGASFALRAGRHSQIG